MAMDSDAHKAFQKYLKTLEVKPGKKIKLGKDYVADYKDKMYTKDEGKELLGEARKGLVEMQDKLYAHNEYSVLIVLQAMDAAGKDSSVEHVMSGLNPTGIKVASFKTPTSNELEHDYFWRHNRRLPPRGEIGIFNRSHYENVLVTRVHPEYILNERLPDINSVEDIKPQFWKNRFEQIRNWEKSLVENGTVIMKFFLYVSKEEQKERFMERIENPEKNWKFAAADVLERQHWDAYMEAYEDLLPATSTSYAPWFVLPADSKWFTRLCLSHIIHNEFEKLNLEYPVLAAHEAARLQEMKALLLSEDAEDTGKKNNAKKSAKQK